MFSIEGRVLLKELSDAIGVSRSTLTSWMWNRGFGHGKCGGYTYEEAFAAIKYYQKKRGVTVDYSKLPSDMADMIISGESKPCCRYCNELMDIKVSKTDFTFWFRCPKCGSQSPVASSRTNALLRAGVES